MAVSAAVRSTSAFGWKGGPQICAILLGIRRPEIGGDDSGYSHLNPNLDTLIGLTQLQIDIERCHRRRDGNAAEREGVA